MASTIWALPGFLGLASDWDLFQIDGLIGVNYANDNLRSMPEWTAHFNQRIHNPSILMGYSLGGRLALHALLDNPAQWKAAIIISAHPGLVEPQEKETRRLNDLRWAERFEKEEWSPLMQAWNGQEVFKNDVHFDRQEEDFNRRQLAQLLLHASLSQQASLSTKIATLPVPILWITGSNDQRYCQLAQDLTFAHPLSRWEMIPEAGHRAPWSQPKKFALLVQTFLANVSGFS